MSNDLTGTVAVVTGSAHGLGLAYASRLLEAGASVAVVDKAGDAAAEVTKALGDKHGSDRVAAFETDVTDDRAVTEMVSGVLTRWGRLDALVNNAGGALYPTAPFESFSRQQWNEVLDVNLTSTWLCVTAVLPQMRRARYGKIVNVSSTTVSQGVPLGIAPYLAAKAGVVGLSRGLARELGPVGIRVNVIAPGFVPMEKANSIHTPEAARGLRDRIAAEQCIPTTLVPDDLAGTVEFLCSASSDSISGQVFNVDGGWVHNAI